MKTLWTGVPLCLGLSAVSLIGQAQPDNVETIFVRGQQAGEQLRQQQALTPGGVTVIDSLAMFERNVASLTDMLRYVPGVWSNSNSGSESMFFSSRGSNLDATNYDMNGIKLLQDGLPVTAADGNNHNRILDPLASRFALVARGANALAYGASTLGGAVDLTTPTARNSDPVQIFLNGGSHGQAIGRLTLGKEFSDTVDGQVTFEGKQWDGFRDHNQAGREGAYSNLGWRINDRVETRLFGTFLRTDEELPGALTLAEFKADSSQADPQSVTGNRQKDVETWRLANKTTFTINENSNLELGISMEQQNLFHPIVDRILVDFDGPGPMEPVEVFSLLIDTDHEDVGLMGRYNIEHGKHKTLIGFNWGQNRVDGAHFRNAGGVRNGMTDRIDYDASSLEIFALDRWQPNEQLTLVYGLQAVVAERETRTTSVSSGVVRNPKGDYDSINPRAGIIYDLNNGVSLFSNVSKLYEAPTNFQLEDDARGNNAPLDAMHGEVVELGTRGRHNLTATSTWHWDVAVYHARIKDEILSRDDPAAPGTSLTVNVDNTIHAGVEALLGATFIHKWGSIEPLLNITLNDFRFDGDANYGNNTLPAAPDYVVRGELLYRHPAGYYAGPTFDFVGERYGDFSNNYTVDAYELLGFRAGYNSDNWKVFVELRNLGSEKYVSTHTVLDSATPGSRILNPGEPRSVYVGLQLSY